MSVSVCSSKVFLTFSYILKWKRECGERKTTQENRLMRNEGRGSQNSLVTKAQRNRGAGPTPLLLCVCVCVYLRGLDCLREEWWCCWRGEWWTLCVCLEREIGVEDHCQHSRRSHTQPKLPFSENASGGVEHSVIPSFLFHICSICGGFLCLTRLTHWTGIMVFIGTSLKSVIKYFKRKGKLCWLLFYIDC